MKRQPLLIDRYLATKPNPYMDKKREQVIRSRLREAKVFALDPMACQYAGEMVKEHPHAIARDMEFAIPPFKNMFVELTSFKPFYEAVVGPGSWIKSPGDPDDGDTSVGYHIDGPRAYVLSGNLKNPDYASRDTAMTPFVYRLNTPFTLKEDLNMAQTMQTSRLELDNFFWGATYSQLIDTPDLRALRAVHSFDWLYVKGPSSDHPDVWKKVIGKIASQCAGDLRNIIALTLFLNRTRDLRYEEPVELTRAMIHAKPSVLLRHSIIRMKLDPKPMLKKIYSNQRLGSVWRRQHDVRGHFCHDKTARDSSHHPDAHDWREYGVNQWRCMLCSGKKWHRKECKRGTRDHGKVEPKYEVTK